MVRDAAPATQGDVRFIAPGVTVAGVVNQPNLELWYSSTPWAKDLEITEAASVVLYFQANAQGVTVFEVRLVDVHPDGRLELLAKDSQQFVTALSSAPVTFTMDAQGRTLWQGHFLRIEVYVQSGNGIVLMQYGGATPSGVQGLNVRWLDTDGDGVADSDERMEGTNSLDPANFLVRWRDSDDDGLVDYMERTIGTNPARADTDGDGFGDGVELYAGSDPRDAKSRPGDSNGNGLPDVFETRYFSNTTNNNGIDAHGDPDGDGCDNLCEAGHGTNPNDPDTDRDGVRDGDEIRAGTNPLDGINGALDTDADGLSDTFERGLGTDPRRKDSDGDGFGDGIEVYAGTNPLDAKSFPVDADHDGLPDAWENKYFQTTNVLPSADPDRDGCDNLCEAAHGTDPTVADSDGDGVPDGRDVSIGYGLPSAAGPRDRKELQLGGVVFALTSALTLFGIQRWKP